MKTLWLTLTTLVGLTCSAVAQSFPFTDNFPFGNPITIYEQGDVPYMWVGVGDFSKVSATNAWNLPGLQYDVKATVTNIVNALVTVPSAASVSNTTFASGQRYTNTSGVLIEASTRVSTTTALIAGGASIEMRVYDGSGSLVITPDWHGVGTALLTLSPTTSASIRGKVPAGYSFAYTNTSTGAGNSATTVASSGQITFLP